MVAIVATAAILLLAPPSPASLASLASDGAAHSHAGMLMDAGADCCPDQDQGRPDQPTNECRPGMACHGGAPAITPPGFSPATATPALVDFGLTSDELAVSRPPDGILRPPRAATSL